MAISTGLFADNNIDRHRCVLISLIISRKIKILLFRLCALHLKLINLPKVSTISQKTFLGYEKNKENSIGILKAADVVSVNYVIASSESFDSVTFVAKDIDIMVLLTAQGTSFIHENMNVEVHDLVGKSRTPCRAFIVSECRIGEMFFIL